MSPIPSRLAAYCRSTNRVSCNCPSDFSSLRSTFDHWLASAEDASFGVQHRTVREHIKGPVSSQRGASSHDLCYPIHAQVPSHPENGMHPRLSTAETFGATLRVAETTRARVRYNDCQTCGERGCCTVSGELAQLTFGPSSLCSLSTPTIRMWMYSSSFSCRCQDFYAGCTPPFKLHGTCEVLKVIALMTPRRSLLFGGIQGLQKDQEERERLEAPIPHETMTANAARNSFKNSCRCAAPSLGQSLRSQSDFRFILKAPSHGVD